MQALGLVWRDVDSISPNSEEVCVHRDEPEHPGACVTFDNWREKRTAGGFVVGRDLPSRALGGVLRNLAICEPVKGGTDYHVRLAGTGFVRRFGCDITGTLLSHLYEPREFQRCAGSLKHAAQGTPSSWDVKLIRDRKIELQYETLLIPVLSPDLSQNWVLAGIFYHDWAR